MTESPLEDTRADVDIRSTERVFDGMVWGVRRDEFDYNGASITREYVDHTGAVAVFALDENDRVLLIKQYRHPVGMREWEIPAGLLDIADEDPLVAAKRELAEEADIQATDWAVLSEFYTTPGGSDEAIRIYLARGISATDGTFDRTDEEADMELRWVALDDLVDAVLARKLQNPSLVIATMAAQLGRERDWSTLDAADAPWPRHPKLRRPGD